MVPTNADDKIEQNFTPLPHISFGVLLKHRDNFSFKIILVVFWASYSNNVTKITAVSQAASRSPEMSVTGTILL
jgi:hypothetical protein